MKLRDYIIVGYILSFLITIAAVFWASNQMLIEKRYLFYCCNYCDCGINWCDYKSSITKRCV